jgi:hypothetical protein
MKNFENFKSFINESVGGSKYHKKAAAAVKAVTSKYFGAFDSSYEELGDGEDDQMFVTLSNPKGVRFDTLVNVRLLFGVNLEMGELDIRDTFNVSELMYNDIDDLAKLDALIKKVYKDCKLINF